MKIKIINRSGYELPSYETIQSAGMDLRMVKQENMADGYIYKLYPGERVLVKTGLYLQLPVGYEAQIRPRSGLALKYGITVLNAPGTIDADYRGEVGVILYNAGDAPYDIHVGERIAQMVIARHEVAEWEEVETLDETDRGEGGFGHSGNK